MNPPLTLDLLGEEAEASVHPTPQETQAGEYEVIIPALPRHALGGGGEGVVQMTGYHSWTLNHAPWETSEIQMYDTTISMKN